MRNFVQSFGSATWGMIGNIPRTGGDSSSLLGLGFRAWGLGASV